MGQAKLLKTRPVCIEIYWELFTLNFEVVVSLNIKGRLLYDTFSFNNKINIYLIDIKTCETFVNNSYDKFELVIIMASLRIHAKVPWLRLIAYY